MEEVKIFNQTKKQQERQVILNSLRKFNVLIPKRTWKGHSAADAAILYFTNRGRQSFSKNQTDQQLLRSHLKTLW